MEAARTTYSFVDTFHFDLVLTSTMTKDDNAVKCNSCPRTFSTPQTGLRLHTNNEHPEPQDFGLEGDTDLVENDVLSSDSFVDNLLS